MQWQVTLKNSTKEYKPVSVIVTVPDSLSQEEQKKEAKKRGIEKIMIKRLWTKADLIHYKYDKIAIRPYDEIHQAKYLREKQEKYDEIKKQKFASGEWKPSKKDIEKYGLDVDN